MYSPLGVRLTLSGSNFNPTVRFADPLPGVVNSFTGADPQKWVTGIPRYATAQLTEVYAGIDAQYSMAPDDQMTFKLLLKPGSDPKLVVFEIAKTVSMVLNPDGSLLARFGQTRFDPGLVYAAPLAFQETASGRRARTARFRCKSR